MNKNSPLGRWLSSEYRLPNLPAESVDIQRTASAVQIAHWLMFGVHAATQDADYWLRRVPGGGLYELLMEMRTSLAPKTAAKWRHFYRDLGVTGPYSDKGQASPTLAVVRIFLSHLNREPDPIEVRKYMRALLRRPTSMGGFVLHVSRSLKRRSVEDGHVFRKPRFRHAKLIPRERIRSELLLLGTLDNLSITDGDIKVLLRALSPFPDIAEESPTQDVLVSTSPDEFSRYISPYSLDLAAMERAIRSMVPSSGSDISEEVAQSISTVVMQPLNDDSGEAFITVLYRALLGRDPDFDGFSHYVDAIKFDRQTRAEIVSEFLRSDEFSSNSRF